MKDKFELNRFLLGTVQWGMHYGISNSKGKTEEDEAYAIIGTAVQKGILRFDTALDYGVANSILVRAKKIYSDIEITTKVKIPNEIFEIKSSEDLFLRNLEEYVKKIDPKNLLLHGLLPKQDFFSGQYEKLFKRISNFCACSLGVSANSPAEALNSIKIKGIQVIQIACNLLDRRLADFGFLKKIEEREIDLQVRSVFLQGLAFLDLEDLDTFFNPLKKSLSQIRDLSENLNVPLSTIWLLYIHEYLNCDIVLGFENRQQLQAITSATFDKKEIIGALNLFLSGSDVEVSEELLEPRFWPINRFRDFHEELK
jgi:aryl-alcohol dehydrogenase-like predicted oxidoreductase